MHIFCKKTYLKNTLITVPVMVMASVVPINNAAAQITPSCLYADAADDTDDDGYASENGTKCLLKPEIINPVTGLAVNFKRAIWLPEDVSGEKTLLCYSYSFDPEYDSEFRPIGSYRDWVFNPPIDDNCVADGRENCGGPGTFIDPFFYRYNTFEIKDGVINGFGGESWHDMDFDFEGLYGSWTNAEGGGYRQWYDNNQYQDCIGISPSGTYETPAPVCIDTDPVGDGWGWDGASSCRIADAILVAGACIDSDPVGDGWGWDGVSSCRINDAPVATAVCVDTDPVGDGWGWNGATSCRTTQAETPACYDWDGDGWGWDGTASCIP